MAAPIIVSNLVQTYGSWQPVWLSIAAASVAAALAFGALASATPGSASADTEKKAN